MTTDAAMERVYRTYHTKVNTYINARIHHACDAEDLTSEVFAKALAAYDTFDEEKASLTTWIYTIANNTLRDYLRRTSSRGKREADVEQDALENLLSEPARGEENLCYEALCEGLAAALETLPARERQIVVLHYYDGLAHRDIAQKMQLSYANVRYLNHKAIGTLQAYFGASGLLD